MLKELPREFKELLKNFYYQEGFVGFLDGLREENGLVYGRGIAIYDNISKNRESVFNLMFLFWDYQEKYNIPEIEQDISYADKNSYRLTLESNKRLKFINKEDFIDAIR